MRLLREVIVITIKDAQGHDWAAPIGQDHPFLTFWKCTRCGARTETHDGQIPNDEPKLKTLCQGPPISPINKDSKDSAQ